MKAIAEIEVKLHSLLDRSELSASSPGRFTRGENPVLAEYEVLTNNRTGTWIIADPSSHEISGGVLRPLACWDWGFESRKGHGCLSLVTVVCCQVEVFASDRSLVQRRPTECGVTSGWGSESPGRSTTEKNMGIIRTQPLPGCAFYTGETRKMKVFQLLHKMKIAQILKSFSCIFHP
jgi:hypothetical protein